LIIGDRTVFGSVVLEIFIGLAFLFITLSVVVTTAQELIAGLLGMRAANLIMGVRNLLLDGDGRETEDGLSAELLEHPALRGLYKGKAHSRLAGLIGNGPSYIPNHAFSAALLDTLRRRNSNARAAPISRDELFGRAPEIVHELPEGRLKELLTLMVGHIGDADRSLQRRAAAVERQLSQWFDEAMDRTSGWYKRRSQAIGLVLAAALVLAVDGDALNYIEQLRTDVTLREALAETAATAIPAAGDATGASAPVDRSLERLLGQLDQIPLGWGDGESLVARFQSPAIAIRSLAGWLMTVLAVSMGAAFWFDLTKKVLNLRASGPTPASSTPPGG
jgi:hypothetical protein